MGSMIVMAVCIPLFGLIFLLKVVGWKIKPIDERKRVGVYLAITLVANLIIAMGMYFGGTAKARFSEVWNYKGIEVRYYEDWDEEVPCRHPKYCTRIVSKIDSEGRSYTDTETYQCGWEHLYDVDYHPEHWEVLNEFGREEGISKAKYHKWVGIFTDGKQTFKDLHRDYHSNDGDMYFSKWPGQFDRMMPVHSIHTYKNKIRVSNSVFKYAEASEEIKKKFPRPADEGNVNPIISYGPKVSAADQLLLRRINAKHGSTQQIHAMVVLFTNEPIGIVNDVLNAWQGPNKNELVTFISLDKEGKVQWADVHSWMDDTTIHAEVRGKAVAMGAWSSDKMAAILDESIPRRWHRKEFADFEYLKIPISMGWFLANFLLGLAVVVGVGWFLHNKWDNLGQA